MEDSIRLTRETPEDKPPREPWSRRKKIVFWSILSAVLVAGIVVGIVLGVQANAKKMRTFTKKGIAYEQYDLEMNPAESDQSTLSLYIRSPRGLQKFIAPTIVRPAYTEEQSLRHYLRSGDEMYAYTAFFSKPVGPGIPSKNYKKELKGENAYTCHMILWENDRHFHYYDCFTNAYAFSQRKLRGEGKKAQKELENGKKDIVMPLMPKANNPLVTGTVKFDSNTYLHVKNGIVLSAQIGNDIYTFRPIR